MLNVVVKRVVIENDCLMDLEVQGCPSRTGKVRRIFDLGDGLVFVTTDWLSAFDVRIGGIPGKGWVLDQLSRFWFEGLRDLTDNHVLNDIPEAFRLPQLAGRVTYGEKVAPFSIECIVRGYLAGSGWKEYKQSGTVCGIKLPAGLRQCDKLPEPIFTPSTKAPDGEHDENITFERACEIVGKSAMTILRDRSLAVYESARRYAGVCGIIIADTKLEWGRRKDDSIILIDEVLTPDSSRFWPADEYVPGRDQSSFDKQYLRDYLEELVRVGKWDKTAKNVPVLPPTVITNTTRKYFEAYTRLTGKTLPDSAICRG